MLVKLQAVHRCFVVVNLHHIERVAVVGRLQHAERVAGERHAHRRQLAQQRLHDIAAHALQAAGAVVFRQRLMFVVIVVGDLDLTGLTRGVVAVNFRQHANLQPPVARNFNAVEHVGAHGEFARQRIAEAGQIVEIFRVAIHLLQRAQQRADQQAAYAAV